MANEPELTAELLKLSRKLVGWSRRELAERAGYSEQAVKYWERKQGEIAGVAVNQMFTVLATAFQAAEHVRKPTTRCGARTRRGTPCKARALPGKIRCKFHGGLSTGPKTAAGRQKIAEAQRRRWAAYRELA